MFDSSCQRLNAQESRLVNDALDTQGTRAREYT